VISLVSWQLQTIALVAALAAMSARQSDIAANAVALLRPAYRSTVAQAYSRLGEDGTLVACGRVL
jgi:hypothetical protein